MSEVESYFRDIILYNLHDMIIVVGGEYAQIDLCKRKIGADPYSGYRYHFSIGKFVSFPEEYTCNFFLDQA
mgnify:CR=1 FL=1